MTLEEAEQVIYLHKSIKLYQELPDRIRRLYNDGKHDEVCNIAFEMASELRNVYESRLSEYPSKKIKS